MNYTSAYNKLIAGARNRVLPFGYCEKHHVIPRSIGGTDTVDNIVRLTVKEHHLAHVLLFRIFRDDFPNLIYAVTAFRTDANKQRIEWRKTRKMLAAWLRRAKSLRDSELRCEIGKLKAEAFNRGSNLIANTYISISSV